MFQCITNEKLIQKELLNCPVWFSFILILLVFGCHERLEDSYELRQINEAYQDFCPESTFSREGIQLAMCSEEEVLDCDAMPIRTAPSLIFSLTGCDLTFSQNHEFQNLSTSPINIKSVHIRDQDLSIYEILGFWVRYGEGEEHEIDEIEDFTLEAGETLRLQVGLTVQESLYEGNVLETNILEVLYQLCDQSLVSTPVELKAGRQRSRLEVSPTFINFGAQEIGESSSIKEITLTNQSLEVQTIESLYFALNQAGVNEQFTLHNDELPRELAPDESFTFGVSYTPALEGSHRTSIAVGLGECQDLVSIPISGNLNPPCIASNPDSIDFGVIADGQMSAPVIVELINCGDLSVEISSVNLFEDETGFSWRWSSPSVETPFMLDAGYTESIELSYRNSGLEENLEATNRLVVQNGTQDTQSLEIPLKVKGGGLGTCQMSLSESVDFGFVARGSRITRELRAVNIGTGTCVLREQTIGPSISTIPNQVSVGFELTQPIEVSQVAAGQILPFEITFSPEWESSNTYQASYTLSYFDPFSNRSKEAHIGLSGVSGESGIEVIPSRIDFGGVTMMECASHEARVRVYNHGLYDRCLTGINFEDSGCNEFLSTDSPIANQDGCIIIQRNSYAEFNFAYEPNNIGVDQCNFVFVLEMSDNSELHGVSLEGEGVLNSTQVDEFVQTSGHSVDVLFVIDNSASMGEEQENLANHFADFIIDAQQFQNDYQIGVITTDIEDSSNAGLLQGNPRIMTRSDEVASHFANAVTLGTSGSGTEKGLAAAQTALSDPLISDTGLSCSIDLDCVTPYTCVEGFCGGANRGFLRDEATLELVFVSDEDDFSVANLNFYVDFFQNIKGLNKKTLFHAHAIVGADGGNANTCSGPGGEASAGHRYVEIANRTEGSIQSVCSSDFSNALQEIGEIAFSPPNQFFISRPAERTSIRVSVNGTSRNTGWSYDDASNHIEFEESQIPQQDESIRVEYNAQCFPRRDN